MDNNRSSTASSGSAVDVTAAGNLPSTYNSEVPAPNTPSSNACGDIVDVPFLHSVDGILKAVEMVFSLVTFICASVWYDFVPLGGGWVQFVSMTAFILTGILYLLYTFRMVQKLADKMPFMFIELCYDGIFTLFYFIAGIVSAVHGYRNPAVVAATVFSFLTCLLYGADCVVRLLAWRKSSEGPHCRSTTTTTSNAPTTPQY